MFGALIMDCPTNLTIQSTDSIFLDTGTNNIIFQNNGTQYGTFSGDASNNLTIGAGSGGEVNVNYTASWAQGAVTIQGQGIINQSALYNYTTPPGSTRGITAATYPFVGCRPALSTINIVFSDDEFSTVNTGYFFIYIHHTMVVVIFVVFMQ
jgi:hypothetical protein